MKRREFALAVLTAAVCHGQIRPGGLPKLGTVDARFQSYNVEMVEVTGGRFWAPYRPDTKKPAEAPPAAALSAPAIDPAAFRQREPINLANPRLRKLAAALGPAYVRVSGTWANSTFFHDSDAPAPAAPPAGFGGILTRAQWRGVLDFSRAVDAKLVTSFAISAGVRDAQGVWTPSEATKILAATRSAGGSIAAAEFFNEPNIAAMGGAPAGYTAASYGRDFQVFRAFAKKAAPEMTILGPGSVGEGTGMSGMAMLSSTEMLKAGGADVDAYSYHYYGSVSKRCAYIAAMKQTTPEAALSAAWLNKTGQEATFDIGLRDQYEAGKPIWLTETGETACGGNPWAAGFLDSFRYLDQLGQLAKKGVQVVAHNTLAASDYALIDEVTLTPRPNYWAALLWHRTMGSTVLDAGPSPAPEVRLYAHCLAGKPGGVGLLAINTDRGAAHDLDLPIGSQTFTLTAANLEGGPVQLNGRELKLGANDAIPALKGRPAKPGKLPLAPASITFLAVPSAGNPACR